jgi:hypothetical protein
MANITEINGNLITAATASYALTASFALNGGLGVTQVTPVTLASGSWSPVSGLYEYNYSNAIITSSSIVDAIPDNSTISIVQAAQILPSTSSSLGSVKLYSTNLPTANIIVTFNIFN